jgi:hypothetical protein
MSEIGFWTDEDMAEAFRCGYDWAVARAVVTDLGIEFPYDGPNGEIDEAIGQLLEDMEEERS